MLPILTHLSVDAPSVLLDLVNQVWSQANAVGDPLRIVEVELMCPRDDVPFLFVRKLYRGTPFSEEIRRFESFEHLEAYLRACLAEHGWAEQTTDIGPSSIEHVLLPEQPQTQDAVRDVVWMGPVQHRADNKVAREVKRTETPDTDRTVVVAQSVVELDVRVIQLAYEALERPDELLKELKADLREAREALED